MFYILHFLVLLSYFSRNICIFAEQFPRSEKNGQGKNISHFVITFLISCLHNNVVFVINNC